MKVAVVALAGFGLLAAPALAELSGTVTADYLGSQFSPGNINVRAYGGGHDGSRIYSWESKFANVTAATGDAALLDSPFVGYCIDLEDGVSTGNTHTWNVTDVASAPDGQYTMGTGKALRLAELWGRYHGLVDTAFKAAAFQLAVWEIVYEAEALQLGTYDVTSGYDRNTGFAVDASWHADFGNLTTLANSWVNGLDGTGPLANLMALTNPRTQDFLVETVPVPVPGAVCLGIVGVSLISRLGRRWN